MSTSRPRERRLRAGFSSWDFFLAIATLTCLCRFSVACNPAVRPSALAAATAAHRRRRQAAAEGCTQESALVTSMLVKPLILSQEMQAPEIEQSVIGTGAERNRG
jgi:hypothetical protein